jgi:hypothetical protein
MIIRLKHITVLSLAVAGALAAGAERSAQATSVSPPPVSLAACIPAPVAAAAAAPARQTPVRAAGQARHVPRANLTFDASTTLDGRVQIDASGGDFGLRKKVERTGRYTLEIATARDRVVFEVTETDVTIARGGDRIIVTPDPLDADADGVRRLLADSAAVRRLRTAGAAFEAAEDDSPAAAAILLSDALVGALTGDVGAPHRVARLLSKRARALVRPAAGRPPSCYYQWEQTMLWAWMDFEECAILWNYGGWCSVRWTMQAESAWFALLSCSGLGLG